MTAQLDAQENQPGSITKGFGISPELRDQILDALQSGDDARFEGLVSKLHPADYADLIIHLDDDDRDDLLQKIHNNLDLKILVDIPHNLRQQVFNHFSNEEIAHAIVKLESDDAIDVLDSLSRESIDEILTLLPLATKRTYENSLSYPQDSAGRLMQREVVCVPPHWNIGEVKTYLRTNTHLPTYFYHIFVVDPRHHPIGKVATSRLLRLENNIVIGDVMRENIEVFNAHTDQEEVARHFHHYGLVSAPVVTNSGRIVGMITVDDVVDVVQEEAEEDIFKLGGVQKDSDFYAPVVNTAYWRIRWLLITLVNSLMASYVISLFEDSIQKITALSFLMTINAAMGGNSGMQVVTVVVRALATKNLRSGEHWRAVFKEVKVGLITGFSCAILLALIASWWVGDPKLGSLLFLALFSNMLWAAFAGTMLPIIIDKMGLDPAVSAGPLLTTTTDIFGYSIFLGLATIFLL